MESIILALDKVFRKEEDVDVCMYGGRLALEYLLEDDEVEEDGELIYVQREIRDWKGLREELSKLAHDIFFDTLDEPMKKYGCVLKSIEFYSPKFYNFETDSIDIEYEFIEKELYPGDLETWGSICQYMQHYIDEIRKESCDGFDSLEPVSINEVCRDDYCFIYAILQEEDIYDDVKDLYDNFVEQATELIRNYAVPVEKSI